MVFLSYLVTCNLEEREYRVYGYKGKQVRDNIHAARSRLDSFSNSAVVLASARFTNIGGGRPTPARS
jgi:CDP-paratose 2-epimerase